jgi:hypothetical protein
MKEIKLTRGQVALVDDEDFEELSKYSWHAVWNKTGNKFYAQHNYRVKNKTKTLRMHRLILGLTDPKIQCDHKDGNGLNNQRENLRKATNRQNQMNQKKRLNCSSKYTGVSWSTEKRKWRSYIRIDDKYKYLGYFDDEIEAAKAYNEAAEKRSGEFANLNKI